MPRAEKTVEAWVSFFKKSSLGLKRKTVELKPHRKEWKGVFEKISSEIKNTLPGVSLHHIGSTSVEGLQAKPILDILAVFKNSQEQLESISFFESLGFVHKGDMVGKLNESTNDEKRHFYSYYDLKEEVDYLHLHTYVKEHPDVEKLLNFRDTLRTKQEDKKEYEEFKKKMYSAGTARKDYTRKKKDFVEKVLKLT